MCTPPWCVQGPKDLQFQAEEGVDGAGSTDKTARELQQASKAMQTALEEAQRRATKLEEVRFVSASWQLHIFKVYTHACAHTLTDIV